jgi:nitrogen fixation NifU-like protein
LGSANKGGEMPDNIDEIARRLQETVLQGYTERLRDELFNAQNIGEIKNPDSHVRITGACGDTVEMYLAIKDGKIDDIKFMTDGCGATIACASYVTRRVKGRTIEDALRMKSEGVDSYFEGLPDESKHCAKLAINTLKAALHNYESKE